MCVCVCACVCVCVKKLSTKNQGLPTKFAPAYVSIFMDKRETIFLDSKSLSFWFGFDISMMFFLFGRMVKKNWKSS